MASFQQSNIRLGRGAFGSVTVVKHIGQNKLYAMKNQYLDDMALEEVLVLSKVKGPHTVAMNSYFWVEPLQTRMYIVEEYYRGGSLYKFLEAIGGPLNTDECRFYAAQMLLAISRIHQQGIADFGIAERLLDNPSGVVRDWNYLGAELNYMSTYNWWNNFFNEKFLGLPTEQQEFIKELFSHTPINRAMEMKLKAHPWFKNYTPADWLAIENRKKPAPFTLVFDGETMVYQPTPFYGRQVPIQRAKKTYSLANFTPVVDSQEY
uniref:Protein kinase domain-containing protein n=1 Tax=Ditylenchus dipsaci TaxID=166011 RepID=A0A915EB36_9BILA